MDTGEILRKSREFVILGNLTRAFDELSKLEMASHSSHFDIISSRHEVLKKRWRAEELSAEEYTIEQNKIIKSVIDGIGLLEKELKIENKSDDGFDQILDDRFQGEVGEKGKEIIKKLLSLAERNENLILSYLHIGAPLTVEKLEMKSGFNKKKVNRILQRLKDKALITRNEYGWLKSETNED